MKGKATLPSFIKSPPPPQHPWLRHVPTKSILLVPYQINKSIHMSDTKSKSTAFPTGQDIPPQKQRPQPGLEHEMKPRPVAGEVEAGEEGVPTLETYKAAGKLMDKKALVTGGECVSLSLYSFLPCFSFFFFLLFPSFSSFLFPFSFFSFSFLLFFFLPFRFNNR